MSLRTRLALVVAAIVAAAVALAAYGAHLSVRRELARETDRFLLERAELVGRGLGPAAQPPFADRRGLRPGVERFFGLDAVAQLVDPAGTVEPLFAGQPELPVGERDRAVARGQARAFFRTITVEGARHRMVTVPAGPRGALQVARSVAADVAVLAGLRNRLLVITGLGVAGAAVAAWAVARRLTGPISRLTRASERVAATQDLTTPVPVHGDDEVGRLATAFNTMLAALATSREQQKRLVVDASHELRTPLTAVRTTIDFLGRADDLDPAERRSLIARTQLELDELATLVAELVELATDVRAEEPVEAVELAQVVQDVAARFRRRTGRAIDVAILAPAARVEGRPALLDRAVANLVDNALKFSPPGAAVEVAVEGARVRVADRGPGIAPEDRERVFDRFYRSPAARTQPGSGLGLAIVRQAAEAHGATVAVRERPGGGTVVELDLGAAVPRA